MEHTQWQPVLQPERSISKTILASHAVLPSKPNLQGWKVQAGTCLSPYSPRTFVAHSNSIALHTSAQHSQEALKNVLEFNSEQRLKKKKLAKKLLAPLNSEGEIFTCYQQPVQWKFEESLTERKCSPLIASSCESFIIWVNWMPNFALSKL